MLELIENKIKELKSLDKHFKIFGAEHHQYQFSSKITASEVAQFEQLHQIELPESYRHFILHFGSQGCGPKYGLICIEQGIRKLPAHPTNFQVINLSNDFKLDSLWNIKYTEGEYIKWEKEYFETKWIEGSMRICHEGCGYYVNLVVSGKEKGNLWLDARASDGGIFPIGHYSGQPKTSFDEWYLGWLDSSLKKMKAIRNDGLV